MNSVVLGNTCCISAVQEVLPIPILAFIFISILMTLPLPRSSITGVGIRIAFYSAIPYIVKGIILLSVHSMNGVMDVYISRIFALFLVGICAFLIGSILGEVMNLFPPGRGCETRSFLVDAMFVAACLLLILWIVATLVLVVP